MQDRAKTVESLTRRLSQIDETDTENIEDYRKDLAGCRIIFYTNIDVNRFVGSGILDTLFDIDWERSKVHYPAPGNESSAELFQSYNYVVQLRSDLVELCECSEFEGLFCEVQVQTILNHAWAEMAHDTIYKPADTPGFGSEERKQFEKELSEAMHQYLIPAGYVFQRIASNVQRLAEGKALIDAGLLEAVVNTTNNKDRLTALKRLEEIVLPFYDDIETVYPDIREKLRKAWLLAERSETERFDGAFSRFGGIEPHQVTAQIAKIVTQCLYIEPAATYALIRDLYMETLSDVSKNQLIKVAEDLAQHNTQVWQLHGPVVQVLLAEELRKEKDLVSFAPLALTIANKILEPDVESMTSTSDSVILSQGSIRYSDSLENARKTVINKVIDFAECVIDSDRSFSDALECLFSVAKIPRRGDTSLEVYAMTYSDLACVIDHLTRIAPKASLNSRLDLESRLLSTWRWKKPLSEQLESSPNVVEAHSLYIENTILLRDSLNSDGEFVAFKTMVGFQAVFPDMWNENSFDYERDQAILLEEQEKLAASITLDDWSQWKPRIAVVAESNSDNLGTLPRFTHFLALLANHQPNLLLDLLRDRETMQTWTIWPIASLLLKTNLQQDVEALLNDWLDAGLYIREIAYVISSSNSLQISTVSKTVEHALDAENQEACLRLLHASIAHYKDNCEFWIEQVFFPCLSVLKIEYLERWINETWPMLYKDSLIEDLSKSQVIVLLEKLADIPRIDYEIERVLVVLASKHRQLVLNWFGQRIKRTKKLSSIDYNPIPFKFHELNKVFQPHADDVVSAMREWWDSEDDISIWNLSYFLSGIYPNFEEPLPSVLTQLVEDGDYIDLEFVAMSLRRFKGRAELLPILREIVASEFVNEKIENIVADVIRSTGMVKGEYGLAQTYQKRAEMLRSWLEDTNEQVVAFAKREMHRLQQDEARENRRGSARIAMRRLDHGEPLVDRGLPDDND
ncbi:MAG: RelA/SpoT domain-containing protein [Gammaproteobacteria bacterium]|nr:RelA/SpoT domain-containing protein [Gammaproteobacteria bacterium]